MTSVSSRFVLKFPEGPPNVGLQPTAAAEPERWARQRYRDHPTAAMSFIHHLTLGFLDSAAIARCEVRPLRELPDGIRDLVRRHADAASFLEEDVRATFSIDGQSATLTSTVVRLPWYSPGPNAAAIRLARDVVALGCTAADVSHGRIVPLSELQTGAS